MLGVRQRQEPKEMMHMHRSVPERARHRLSANKAQLLRFPMRCIWLVREGDAWLVLAGSYGSLHGDHNSAFADAKWLSANFGGLHRRHSARAARRRTRVVTLRAPPRRN